MRPSDTERNYKELWDEAQRRLALGGYDGTSPYEYGQSIYHPYHPNNPSNPYARKPGNIKIASPDSPSPVDDELESND